MAGIYGLSGSGMDIDSLVKNLMKAQRVKYDTLQQKKTQLEWKKADYNSIYTSINDFRSNTVFNYKLQGTLMPKAVTSSDETKVTVTANADAANVGHTMTVAQLADGVKKTSSSNITTGTAKDTLNNQFTGLDTTSPMTIQITNGTETSTITVDPNKSIYELVSSINSAGVNVKANYDATLDRFMLYSTNMGSSAEINFTGSSASGVALLSKLNLNTATEKGKDAEFALDGIGTGVLGGAGNLKMSSNTFTISGIIYNLKATGTVNVNVTSDIDKTVANVKSFIESYNATLSKINTEFDETKYKDYLPLTDDQKSSMTDSDITAWESKAKSGLLHNDSILRSLASTMRNDLSTPVSGLTGYTSASSIGITTGSWFEGGKLYLDETQLRKALQTDPEVVNKIFSTNKDGNTQNQNGIAVRLYDTLKTVSDKIATEAGASASTTYDTKSNLAKQIETYTKAMTTLNTRLENLQEAYYTKFNAMETALNKLSQQSSWLSQQLGTSSS